MAFRPPFRTARAAWPLETGPTELVFFKKEEVEE